MGILMLLILGFVFFLSILMLYYAVVRPGFVAVNWGRRGGGPPMSPLSQIVIACVLDCGVLTFCVGAWAPRWTNCAIVIGAIAVFALIASAVRDWFIDGSGRSDEADEVWRHRHDE
jgi:hypothetical protein